MQGEVIPHNIVDLCTPSYIIIRIVMTLSSVNSFPGQCEGALSRSTEWPVRMTVLLSVSLMLRGKGEVGE